MFIGRIAGFEKTAAQALECSFDGRIPEFSSWTVVWTVVWTELGYAVHTMHCSRSEIWPKQNRLSFSGTLSLARPIDERNFFFRNKMQLDCLKSANLVEVLRKVKGESQNNRWPDGEPAWVFYRVSATHAVGIH